MRGTSYPDEEGRRIGGNEFKRLPERGAVSGVGVDGAGYLSLEAGGSPVDLAGDAVYCSWTSGIMASSSGGICCCFGGGPGGITVLVSVKVGEAQGQRPTQSMMGRPGHWRVRKGQGPKEGLPAELTPGPASLTALLRRWGRG